MALLNYTTKIAAHRTASEIQTILAKHGATGILLDYKDGQVVAIAFKADTPYGPVGIRLPVDVEATLRVLRREASRGKIARHYAREDQARRVAWRIIKDWVEAQMALLQTEMVRLEEIFLPYILTESGRTVFQLMVDSKFQLPQGERT